MGVFRSSVLMLFYSLAFTLILMTVPGIPPYYKFEPYQIRPPRRMEGKLSPNDILDRAELVVDGEFVGPESVALKGDEVYTGVESGHIIKVDGNGKWKAIAKIPGGDCDGSWKKPCPRPLGLRFARNGNRLVVADAYKGLVEVDVSSGTTNVILPVGTVMEDGLPLHFPDDLDIDRDGNIYFSDASQVGSMYNVFPEVLAEPTGRLIKFDPKTGKTEVLISGLHFANGVQLSRKEDFVVVCETVRSKVIKYHLKGPKSGTKETLIEGLPGMPDNIRSNGMEGFYISLVVADTQEIPNTVRQFMPLPSVRKLALRVQYIMLRVVELIDTLLPNRITEAIHSYVSHFGPVGDAKYSPRKVIIVDVDESGNIIGSLQNSKGFISHISEIGLGEKYTYFGSPYSDKLWRIKTEYLA